MASRTRTAQASASDDENWEEIQEEAQFKFDEDGDTFTGILTSRDVNGTIPQGHFVGTGLFKGEDFFINLGRDLEKKLSKVPLGSEVKLTRTGTQETGQKSPMMLFKVNYREV
jgi:hypothetical protein